MKPIRESVELDWSGVHMSDGRPMNADSKARQDEGWARSGQGKMIAARQAREERARRIRNKLKSQPTTDKSAGNERRLQLKDRSVLGLPKTDEQRERDKDLEYESRVDYESWERDGCDGREDE